MTKAELTYLVMTSINGGDVVSDKQKVYHPGDVAIYLEMAFSALLYQQMSQARDKEGSTADVRKVMDVPEVKQDKGGLYYFDIPKGLISLAGQPRVASVFVRGRRGDDFVTEAPEESSIYSDLEVSSTHGFGHASSGGVQRSMNIQGDKVYLSGYTKGQSLQYEGVAGFSMLDDHEELVLPKGSDIIFLQTVKNLMFGPQDPTLEINDTESDSNVQSK